MDRIITYSLSRAVTLITITLAVNTMHCQQYGVYVEGMVRFDDIVEQHAFHYRFGNLLFSRLPPTPVFI